MKYPDGELVEIGDLIEIDDAPDICEPEEAVVIKIGTRKLQAKYTNEMIKPRKDWVFPDYCVMISRDM